MSPHKVNYTIQIKFDIRTLTARRCHIINMLTNDCRYCHVTYQTATQSIGRVTVEQNLRHCTNSDWVVIVDNDSVLHKSRFALPHGPWPHVTRLMEIHRSLVRQHNPAVEKSKKKQMSSHVWLTGTTQVGPLDLTFKVVQMNNKWIEW